MLLLKIGIFLNIYVYILKGTYVQLYIVFWDPAKVALHDSHYSSFTGLLCNYSVHPLKQVTVASVSSMHFSLKVHFLLTDQLVEAC